MAVFRPQYRDKKTGEMKHTEVWYYKFIFAGRIIKESAKTTSKTVAREAEKRRRREMEAGFNGLVDSRQDRVTSLREISRVFLKDYFVRQPKSASFAEHALRHVDRRLGDLILVDITDKVVLKYQTDRLGEGAAPKTVNEEVGLLLRLLPVTHAGAIRAQLRQQKKLKLRIQGKVGKAFSPEQKAALLEQAGHENRRSKAIHFATSLAFHAGLRDKEIRTLQWSRLNIEKRMIIVGETKTSAGTGRTIPMNDDLLKAALEYVDWYSGRFGVIEQDWYVFPFGKPRPSDPTRPQTSFKTAWQNTRKGAQVEGRFHDARHTFVTELAEGGPGDQVIQDLAGHVSRDMVKHYSHIRTEAKRHAVEALSSKAGSSSKRSLEFAETVQDSVQVRDKRRAK